MHLSVVVSLQCSMSMLILILNGNDLGPSTLSSPLPLATFNRIRMHPLSLLSSINGQFDLLPQCILHPQPWDMVMVSESQFRRLGSALPTCPSSMLFCDAFSGLSDNPLRCCFLNPTVLQDHNKTVIATIISSFFYYPPQFTSSPDKLT